MDHCGILAGQSVSVTTVRVFLTTYTSKTNSGFYRSMTQDFQENITPFGKRIQPFQLN